MNEASTHQHPQPDKHYRHHNTCSGGCGSSTQPSSSSTARSGQQSPVSPAFDHHTMTSPRQSPQGADSPVSPSSHQPLSESQDTARASSPAAHSTAMASMPASHFHQQTSHASPSGPSTSIPPPSSLPGSSTSHQQAQGQARLPTAAQRRRARELATVLLTLATCQGCRRPVQDPVTLPCGHSSCLQCIKDRVLPRSIPPEDQVQPLPCLSHLPPRLPLSPMTVPCPAHGCPRSAIGRGIGVWAGHLPRYGLIPTYTERLPLDAQDVGPGAPPVDGFVMGVADHPLRLTVIGPQTRSKAHLFAVPPQGVEPINASAAHQTATTLLPSLATSNMLRPDVTLSKAVAILMRYASSPLPHPPRQRRSLPVSTGLSLASRRSRHTRPGRTAGTYRDQSASTASSSSSRARAAARSRRSTLGRSSARGQGASSLVTRRSHRPATSHAGMGIFGQNESELESGTVGGVRATASDSEDNLAHESDLDTGLEAAHGSAYLRAVSHRGSALAGRDDDTNVWTLHAAPDGEFSEEENSDRFWPDRVGGAYSRPLLSNSAARRRGKAQLKRRRERRSDGSVSSANSPTNANAKHSDGKAAKTEAVAEEAAAARHLDSDWSTEESTASARLHRDNGREALVDAIRRRRAVQAHKAVGSASDADTDLDGYASDAHHGATEAKHSLALSSKVGPNGEPLIQSAATLHSELVEVLECQLCYLLLYDPLTTPCGHTFCKSCFARSLDHGDRCPLCRADMPNFSFFQDHRPNTALLKILTSDTATFSDEDALDSDATQDVKAPSTSKYAGLSIALSSDGGKVNVASGEPRTGFIVDDDPESAPHHYGFKRLYEQRKSAIEQEEREARLSTPIFVCTLAFPGMPTILHIFEPRYRLMVRRCLESGNPRFGMVLPSRNNGGTEEFGTMLEIKSVQMLADGRSMLETVGSYRFRLLEKGSLDGYTVGRVERVDDISLEEEAELERAVLLRRTELERKKAAEAAVERPRAIPMAPSSSAPVHAHADRPSGDRPSGTIVARPEMSRAESDALSIYRSGHSPVLEPRQQPATETQPDQASGEVVASRSPTDSTATADERRSGHGEEGEEGLSPFKPVPAEPSIEELVDICTSFIETLRSGSAPWLLSRLNHTYGPMPSADEVERLGYWMALVMPIDEHEKAKLLPIRSRRLRLCLVVHWIEQLRQSWWFNSGCTVS